LVLSNEKKKEVPPAKGRIHGNKYGDGEIPSGDEEGVLEKMRKITDKSGTEKGAWL